MNEICATSHGNHYILGTCIHKVLQDFNKLPEIEQSFDSLLNLLNKYWTYDSSIDLTENDNKFNEAKNMLHIYSLERKDIGTTLLSEEMIFNNVNVFLTVCGKIDRFFLNSDNKLELIDYKTTSKPNFIIDINTDIQIPIYLTLLNYKLNLYPNVVSYYYLYSNTKISIDLDINLINLCVERLKGIINEMSSEKLFLREPGSKCNFCEFNAYCKNICHY